MTNINTIHSALTKNINNTADGLKAIVDGQNTIKGNEENTFSNRIKDSLESINGAQKEAADLVKQFELGKESDVSKVMVAQQVSSLGFHMVLNVRNKAIGAYREIMNMQV